MAIKLINGTHIENLTAELASELRQERVAKGAFEFLKVAVANPNLGNGSATYLLAVAQLDLS